MRRLVFTVFALAILLQGHVVQANDDVVCVGNVGAITIHGNVRVPAGCTCRMEGTRVYGNVLVEPDAALTTYVATIRGDVTVKKDAALEADYGWFFGKIAADMHRRFRLNTVFVSEGLKVEDGGEVILYYLTVGEDVIVKHNENRHDDSLVQDCAVLGDLKIEDHRGRLKVLGNTVKKDMVVKGNQPAPFTDLNIVGKDVKQD